MSSRCIGQVNDQSLVTNSVFAGFIHEAVQENQQVILSCRRSVRGKVTWSRESAGSVYLQLTVPGTRNTMIDLNITVCLQTSPCTFRELPSQTRGQLTVIPSGNIKLFY